MSTIIQVRRGTAALWTSVNPLLAQGEQGLETDTGKTKTGTGLPGAVWTTLPYDTTGGGGGSALEVQDEGVSLSTAVTKINFVGGGVTVTEPVADQMQVSIPAPPAPAITGVSDTATIDMTLAAGAISGIVKADSIGPTELTPAVEAELALAHAAVTVLDSAHIDFTLTGQQITATVKPDSIGSTELDPTVDAALALAHDPVTVTDTPTIDLTLVAQALSAIVKAGSITTTELDPAVVSAIAGAVAASHSPVSVTDSATIDLTLTGQDITASVKPDSIGSTELNPTVDAALALAHAAASVTDSSTIDFTLTGQNITAIVKPDSIGSTELAPAVDAALALAHAAVTVTDSASIDFTLTGQDVTAVVKVDSIGTSELSPAVEAMLAGYVVGPASSVVDEIARFSNTSGKLLKAGLKYQTAPDDQTAGALLTQGAYGLQTALLLTDPDLNAVVVAGNYYINGTSTTNFPPTYTGIVGLLLTVVADFASKQVSQFAVVDTAAAGPVVTFRIGFPASLGGSGVWSAWSEAAVSALAVSTSALNSSFLKSGFYGIDVTAANTPTGTAGHLIVQRSGQSPVIVAEIFITGNTIGATAPASMYMRTRNGAATTWNPWRKMYDSLGQNVNTSPTGSMGFATGAGGTNTQATSKATAVTMATPKPVGNIITAADVLNANTDVVFTFNNSLIEANDTVHVCVAGPSNTYVAEATYVRAGAVDIVLRNRTGTNQSQAVTINYVITKGAIS